MKSESAIRKEIKRMKDRLRDSSAGDFEYAVTGTAIATLEWVVNKNGWNPLNQCEYARDCDNSGKEGICPF